MSKEIRIVLETDDRFIFLWDNVPNASYYNVVALDNRFVFQKVLSTDKEYVEILKEKLKDNISLRIDAIFYSEEIGQEVVIEQTALLPLIFSPFESIKVSCLKSYQGYSLSFLSPIIYDRYCLFEKVDEKLNLILESEDFQVTSTLIKKGHSYYVEAYQKVNDQFKVAAKSGIFNCQPKTVPIPKLPIISFVIPVCNLHFFLSRCIDSILFSSFIDKEIILVDDFSEDDSSKIMEWYQKRYPEIIRLFHCPSKGVSNARNTGLLQARGEYVAFTDGDDLVHPAMHEKLYSFAQKNDLDVCIGKAIIRNDLGDRSICLDVKKGKDKEGLLYSYDEMFLEKNNNTVNNIFFVALWNKIIRTSLLKEHPLPSFHHYEDSAHTNMIYSYIDTFGFVPSAFYVWDKRIRKTVGTYSSTYRDDDDPLRYQRYFCESVLFPVMYGNPLRMDYLVYSSVVDAVNFLIKNKIDPLKKDDKMLDIYKETLLKIHELGDINQNERILQNQEVADYITKLFSVDDKFLIEENHLD